MSQLNRKNIRKCHSSRPVFRFGRLNTNIVFSTSLLTSLLACLLQYVSRVLVSIYLLPIVLVSDASFLGKFSSEFHEHFVTAFSWMTSLNKDVVYLLTQRCVDRTFSPAVVRRLLGILQYRFVFTFVIF